MNQEECMAGMLEHTASMDAKFDAFLELRDEFILARDEERTTHEKLDKEIAILVAAIAGFNSLIRKVLTWAVLGLLGLSGSLFVFIAYLLIGALPPG